MKEPFDQLDPLPNPPTPKRPLGIVVFTNFCIMIIYTMLVWASKDERDPYSGLENLIMNALYLVAQVVLNLLIGLVLVSKPKYKPLGSAMLIGGVIIAVIGLGTCLAAEDYS